MSSQEDIKFANGVVLDICVRTILQYFALGLIMGGALFLCSFFQAEARADYFRWMSVVIVALTSSLGLIQVIRVLVRHAMNRRKNRHILS
jgi:hypothetical protein